MPTHGELIYGRSEGERGPRCRPGINPLRMDKDLHSTVFRLAHEAAKAVKVVDLCA